MAECLAAFRFGSSFEHKRGVFLTPACILFSDELADSYGDEFCEPEVPAYGDAGAVRARAPVMPHA